MKVAVLIIRVPKTTQGIGKIIFIPVDEHFKVLHITIIPLYRHTDNVTGYVIPETVFIDVCFISSFLHAAKIQS
jgi:hypothetical protein